MNDRLKFRCVINNKVKDVFYFYELPTNKEIVFACTNLEDNIGYNIPKDQLLQCTGLKDKNDKLIYEGDVVRYTEYEIEDIEPEWEQAEIVWGGNHDYPAFDLKQHEFDCNGLAYIFNEGWTIKVIGNIYENKELLKECE